MGKTDNIKMVISYFTDNKTKLPPNLTQLCLEFSGCLRIGRKSLMFMVVNMPKYKGRRMRRIAFEK